MDGGKLRAATQAPAVRFLLAGVFALALLAVTGGGLYLSRGTRPAGLASGQAVASRAAATAGCGAAAAGGCAPGPQAPAATAPPAAPAPSHRPSPPSARPAVTPVATARPPAAPAPAPPSAPPAPGGSAAAQVLSVINQARSAAGLPALATSPGLQVSSSAHNLLMAGGCGLSHQCPGELAIGARETAAGVHWTAAGENIGEGGPVPDSPPAIAQMATGLTQSMLAEKPPDDGHRMNILSSAFAHIGIAVYRDSSGTVWLTQDFSS